MKDKLTIVLGSTRCPPEIENQIRSIESAGSITVELVTSQISERSPVPLPSATFFHGQQMKERCFGKEAVLALVTSLALAISV